jgi:hypothetical protein
VLYQRLGSYEIAVRYFREALASPDLEPGTRERIEANLPDTEKNLRPSRFSGFIYSGLRYQSNANYAPAGGILRLGGLDYALSSRAVLRKPDWNWFGIVGLSHDYDLQNQRGDVIETRLIGYGTKQQRFDQLDLGFFEASFGPRLALAPDALPAWLSPPTPSLV